MSARVTWIMPVKNGMPYLPETLASIAAQTYREWEVLAWDNGSTDGSVEVLQEWIPARLPGRVVTDRPLHLGASLAGLVDESRTELVARIDADDINEPPRLAAQVAALDASPELVAVGAWMQGIDGIGQATDAYDYPPVDRRALRWQLFFANPLCHPTMCLRRAAVLRAGNYADIVPGQDYDLWLRLVQVGAMANVPQRLLRYRTHAGSVSAQHDHRWARMAHDVARRQAAPLFPGVPVEDAMRVWAFASHFSPTCGRNAPEPELVFALARAASVQAGWAPDELTQLPAVRVLAARCMPWRPRALWWRLRYRERAVG